MSYQQALSYLYAFSDFERTGQFSRDPEQNIQRMRQLLAVLGNPHLQFSATHVAGTKGKGSTAVLIAAALQKSGIAVGLYTQPDLHTFRERIVINGQIISEDDVAVLVERLQQAIATLPQALQRQLITFELGTALAFMAFASHGVRHAVIEVGLGGRLDPTNVIQPLVGVITPISFDHMSILGTSIAEIAHEKAGIIKHDMIVVTGPQIPEAMAVIAQRCASLGVPLIRVGNMMDACEYTYEPAAIIPAQTPDMLIPQWCTITYLQRTQRLQIGLQGEFQCVNAATALAALDALQSCGLAITPSGVEQGFLTARWPARMDIVGYQPWIVVDGAHNADSLAKLLQTLPKTLAFSQCHLIIGMMRDKDIAGISDVLLANSDTIATIWTVAGTSPRAYTAAELIQQLPSVLPLRIGGSVEQTIPQVMQRANPQDVICITGSLHLAGEALRWIAQHHTDPLSQRIVIAGNDHSG